ncbi:MAG: hypothetical protein GY859_16505, partial [Desulfobacterales bacterium]|nr:hypothetical protein [Desulfobacterales bacterium]
MIKKAAWAAVVFMAILASGVVTTGAEEAVLFDLPTESAGAAGVVAPAGGGAWVLEKAEKKIAYLKASEGLGRTMVFPTENSRILATGSETIDAPINQTVTPTTRVVTPSVVTLSPVEQNGWYEFSHQLGYSVNLIHSRDRLWFTSATDNTVASLDPAGQAGAGGSVYTLSKWVMPTADSGPDGIAAGTDGAVWVVCRSGLKLVRLDPVANEVTEWDFPNASRADDPGIVVTESNLIWIADSLGAKLHRFNPSTNQFTAFSLKFQTGGSDLGLDSNDDIWMSVADLGWLDSVIQAPGLLEVGNSLTWYELPPSFTDPHIIGITPFGRLWCVSRTSHQIGEFDPATRIFTSRTFPDTPSGETLGLAIDPDGDVWFTNEGSNFVGYIANAAHHT